MPRWDHATEKAFSGLTREAFFYLIPVFEIWVLVISGKRFMKRECKVGKTTLPFFCYKLPDKVSNGLYPLPRGRNC